MRTSVRDVFAVAAASYDGGNPLLELERPETTGMLPWLAGKDVLDLGAGTGYYARLAAELGARLALAVDLTPEMLRRAPRPAVVGDAARLPLAELSFDVAIAGLLISFVELEPVLEEAARVLRPGGMLVASDLHPVASARGWRRSFPGKAGERLVIDAPPPSREHVERALAAAGLVLESFAEPAVDERLRGAFERAGRRDFETLAGTPLLQIFRARKREPHAR